MISISIVQFRSSYRLTRKLEREVKGSEHDGEEDPPSACTSNECECACRFLKSAGESGVAVRNLPIGAGEATERDDQREEDYEEHDIGAQRQDEVDQAKQAHTKQEEGEAGVESNSVETGRWI
jgi:hypothetical protein